jgi:cellobiose phosphorylase
VIPESWPGFTATRVFRGVTYRIDVRRAGSGNAVALEVEGKPVPGNVVPLPGAGVREVAVMATVGSEDYDNESTG